MSSSESVARVLEAIRALPRRDRLRLIEHVSRELAEEEVVSDPTSIIGCMADDAELLDQVVAGAMNARKRIPLRRSGA